MRPVSRPRSITSVRLASKGRLTIPVEIRRRLSWHSGTELAITVGQLVMIRSGDRLAPLAPDARDAACHPYDRI
jgi:AbrB family looped-hinge helix DNA binding protein